jgi:hypothetical protein
MKTSPGISAFWTSATVFDAAGRTLDGRGNYCVGFDPHRAGCREHAALGA